MLCKYCLYKHVHTFLSITLLIFNGFSIRKKFWTAENQSFLTIPNIYACRYSRYRHKISNAFNAMLCQYSRYKHVHTFLSITLLIFNRFSIRKKFCTAKNQSFLTIPNIHACRYCNQAIIAEGHKRRTAADYRIGLNIRNYAALKPWNS